METKEWTNLDRKDWPSGPWDGEPDKVQWKDEDTGLPCIAVRHPRSGHWCGYVGVTEGHPAFERGYNDVEPYPDVHGGLTYANLCQPHEDEEGRGICHVPSLGEPDKVWWLGFDCHHSGDWSPSDAAFQRDKPETCWRQGFDETYKTIQYVKNQCADLARQLSAR